MIFSPQSINDASTWFCVASLCGRHVACYKQVVDLTMITVDDSPIRYDTIEEINVDLKAEYTA